MYLFSINHLRVSGLSSRAPLPPPRDGELSLRRPAGILRSASHHRATLGRAALARGFAPSRPQSSSRCALCPRRPRKTPDRSAALLVIGSASTVAQESGSRRRKRAGAGAGAPVTQSTVRPPRATALCRGCIRGGRFGTEGPTALIHRVYLQPAPQCLHRHGACMGPQRLSGAGGRRAGPAQGASPRCLRGPTAWERRGGGARGRLRAPGPPAPRGPPPSPGTSTSGCWSRPPCRRRCCSSCSRGTWSQTRAPWPGPPRRP